MSSFFSSPRYVRVATVLALCQTVRVVSAVSVVCVGNTIAKAGYMVRLHGGKSAAKPGMLPDSFYTGVLRVLDNWVPNYRSFIVVQVEVKCNFVQK